MSKHIDEFALFLYAIGCRQLKKEAINQIQEHLEQCPACTEHFEQEVQNLATLLRERKEELTRKLNVKPVLNTLAKFLTAPKGLESLRWFEEAYGQLASVLRKGYIDQLESKTGKIPIVPRGFMSTESQEEEESIYKDEKSDFTLAEKQMIGNISSLFQILADDTIDISERAKLTKELYTIAKQKSENIKSETI